ncbi:carboxylesterase/lipase family protein [Dongia sp.]|uniref:carboxylesterase/lipase family protein n=1 Tax=Dongia sp. TaxID=1977262 RepID=UPI0035B2820F
MREESIVETSNGSIRGVFASGVHSFRGVRYGDTTAGKNRFRPPQPAPKWAGVITALRPGASAPQLRYPENTDPFFAWYSQIETPSEDCLFLNVFTPELRRGRRPVMVWIHGGGWYCYAGTAPGFDGTALARGEDVVVIAINHRLGVFGHLALDEGNEVFADSGNVGLLDVVAALCWVRDNAAAFGGDPANVTIFGESGGGSKVAALLAMRRAEGLFHRAIVQSSGSGMKLADESEAKVAADGLRKALGIANLAPEVMQSLSMDDILAATKLAKGPFRGMIDGRSFNRHPYENTAPSAARDIPLMIGHTLTEGTYYMRGDPRNFTLELAEVRRRLARFLEIEPAKVDEIIAAYRAEYPAATPSQLLFLSFSDFMFARNTYHIAELQSASANAPVFTYCFSWRTPIEGGRMGSPHTCEVPFIFGTTNAASACVGDGPDLQIMTERMMASWAAFARTGSPCNAALPAWEPFDRDSRGVMILDNSSRMARDPGGAARATMDSLPHFGYGHSIPAVLGA